ncbi:hypothetical protein [Methanothrix sp.]|nr:hypothetical protein [Methanothrix sp.]
MQLLPVKEPRPLQKSLTNPSVRSVAERLKGEPETVLAEALGP